MQKNRKRQLSLYLLLAVALLAGSCQPQAKTPLVVFAAGSLIKPFDDLEKAFETKNTQIDVQSEYHGSIQVIRQVTDLHQKIDVIATADEALIPLLMYRETDAQTGKPYADWYLRFATNSLGIAYSAKSKYADEINEQNWTQILSRPDVRVGIADPRFDASGYRAMMVFKLAEQVYQQPNLFSSLFAGQFRYPVKVDENGPKSTIRIPEIMETRSDAHIVLRGASVQLLALLESGDLDYAFEYESVIQQHGLKLIHLPDSLNLGAAANNDEYGQVAVKLDFKRFASVTPEFQGGQIGYGITIPANAPHPEAAQQFITFLLSAGGRKIMQDDHHPIFAQILANGFEHLPQNLKPLAVPGQ
jgi:molybdate/tungstate transport system substrate-binding protein